MPTRERHPITDIDRRLGLFSNSTTVPEVTAYQTKFVGVGAFAHVVRQAPVGHPSVYKGKRRDAGAEPKEADHVRVL